jgi:hypothetical protein
MGNNKLEETNDDIKYQGKHMGIDDPEVVEELSPLTGRVNLDQPDCALDKVMEEREQMTPEAAEHIKMARAQPKLYQDKVEATKRSVNKVHSQLTYTFVVDYGQNMKLPVFKEQQAGAMYYYFSPITVNNHGMVDHAHKYPDGKVSEICIVTSTQILSGGRV